MINKLKKVKLVDLLGFFILIFAFPCSIVVRFMTKNKPIWLVCELKDTARDNGYHFFKYIRINHPEVNCYYAINKKSNDYNKIAKYGNVIQFGSFKHWVYYLSSKYNISSHKEGNPNHLVFTIVHLYLHMLNNRVFLQHGITKDDAPMFYYKNTYFKYFVCGAKKEYDFIKTKFCYPDKNLIYTGLARFDNLDSSNINHKQILLIPTWRRWFETTNSNDFFESSEYFEKWNNFINNDKLLEYLEEKNITLIFYPHFAMRKFIKEFNVSSNNIRIIKDDNVDIQELLKSSALMITDYSSVYMDFAYMRKPIIYYQFDYDEYRKSHFKEGYFDYERDGFGEVVNDEKELVELVKYYCSNNYKIKDNYLKRMQEFFPLYDKDNCKRIYEYLKEGE